MLLDVRTYRCRPGTINKQLELYEAFGKEPFQYGYPSPPKVRKPLHEMRTFVLFFP